MDVVQSGAVHSTSLICDSISYVHDNSLDRLLKGGKGYYHRVLCYAVQFFFKFIIVEKSWPFQLREKTRLIVGILTT